MSVQGVSTRTGKAVTEELCGHTFSASTVSRIKKSLDGLLRRVAQRRLEEASPDVILDARDEKVRRDGVIQSSTVDAAGRWCADAGRPTRFKPSSPSPTDAVRDGSAKLGHPVQNVTREHGLTPLPR